MVDFNVLSAREIERMARVIKPGEWAVENERPISTLLGSCVAVCLYDVAAQVAGMNHFMLPSMKHRPATSKNVLLAGDACMAALLDALLARGATRFGLQAKAFGGGSVIEMNRPGHSSIGQVNADFAREWLGREQIPLLASDFLGPWARKVLLLPNDGVVYCKRQVTSMISQESVEREVEAYVASLPAQERPEGANR